ncbi:CDP-diacylglycerol inositol 3-phosphatidyltransferase [Georgenia satyanarayanai]|uniref:Phosphatidylinositol phosphate synthase n=1 Tax=Georgenia satyanarayanai TaxID=860221 RepID=A0A2Y9C2Y4_9MICO|nr:CDP-diacylglycerol inositol 3-phosphatidyltransferase [Georgenia satyanarayanai]SSA36883.1 CDP-diacylglycerol inositol 3-phosphatidyltransferase [Georgenia satyanarayanai]
MLSSKGRVVTNAIFGPVARTLVRAGVSPDTVTVTGTVLTVAVALWLLPSGHFVAGPLAITVVVLIDSVDGLMARMLGRSTRWGAFLDSTLDRVADAAIFSGILLWSIGAEETWVLGTALACLVLGSVVPYAKARAEGLGMTASGGIAERADRLFVALAAVLAVGLGAPVVVLVVALGLLALASLYTVGQRMAAVHRQTRGDVGETA